MNKAAAAALAPAADAQPNGKPQNLKNVNSWHWVSGRSFNFVDYFFV
jgi:hypothetical protein